MSGSPYSGAVCRGSIILGTACRTCEKCKDELAKLEHGTEPVADCREETIIIVSEGKSLADLSKITTEKMSKAAFVLTEGDQVLKNRYGSRGRIIDPNRICKGSPYLGTGCMECPNCIEAIKSEFMKKKVDEEQVRGMLNVAMMGVILELSVDEERANDIMKEVRSDLYNRFNFSVIENENKLIPVTVAMIEHTCGYAMFMERTGTEIGIDFSSQPETIVQVTKADAIALGIIKG